MLVHKSGLAARVWEMDRDQSLLDAFAHELRSRRFHAALSQEALADLANLNRTYIAKLELGKNQPSLCALLGLAKALKVGLPELISTTLDRYLVERSQKSRPSEPLEVREGAVGTDDEQLESNKAVTNWAASFGIQRPTFPRPKPNRDDGDNR